MRNPIIKGNWFYQVCTDIDGKCIPFDEEFDFSQLILGQKPTEETQVIQKSNNASSEDSASASGVLKSKK